MTQILPFTAADDVRAGAPRADAVRAAAGPRTRTRSQHPGPDGAQRRRALARLRATDVYALAAAAAAALCLSWLVYAWLAPFSGALGFALLTYALFLAVYALVVSLDESGSAVRDRLAAAVVTSLGFVLLSALVFIVAYTFVRAAPALTHLNFYTEDLSVTGALQPLSSGGVRHAVIGTLEQITVALLLTIPLGITCAVFLGELPGPYARFVRTIVEAMTALPSIVAGLFVYSSLVLGFTWNGRHYGIPRSGFAAAIAISVMMLPIIIRASDVVLRLVAGTLKEASYALGASQWRTVWTVVLPTARSGLTTAVILGTARGVGETSPVLITAGFTNETNGNLFSGEPQVSLPLLTFGLTRAPEAVQIQRGFGAAAVLLTIVLALFVVARLLGGRAPGDLSPRQRRLRAVQSEADLERYRRRRAGRGLGDGPLAAVVTGPPAGDPS